MELKPDERMRLADLLGESTQVLRDANAMATGEGHQLAGVVCLFSGGNDSTVLAHMSRNFVTHFAHCNTGIGIEQTRQFVRDTVLRWGKPLIEKHPDEGYSYRELVLGIAKNAQGEPLWKGFPGPAAHYMAYQRLKERGLRQVRRELVKDGRRQRVIFLAGRRAEESGRRGARFKAGELKAVERVDSVVWASPLVSWSKLDLNLYRKAFPDVPRNEVSDLLHMSGECLCVAPSTLVATATGWKPIQDIHEGELVAGRLRERVTLQPVAQVHRNEAKPMLRLKPYYLPAIEITGNHLVWARPYDFHNRNLAKQVQGPQWKEAARIAEDFRSSQGKPPYRQVKNYIGRPFAQAEKTLQLSEAHLRLLGYFTAEGAYQWRPTRDDKPHGIVFTVSHKSRLMALQIKTDMEEALGIPVGWREYTDKRTNRDFIMVRTWRSEASDFVGTYTRGRYCWEKTLTQDVIEAPLQQQKLILDAMWEGDGSHFQREARNERSAEAVSAYGTKSRGLALQVQEMLLRRGEVYGVSASGNDSYLVRRSNTEVRNGMLDMEAGVLWCGIQSVDDAAAQETWNLTMAGEPNYLTEAGLVHNCGAFGHPGELDEIGMWFPGVVEEIRALEAEALALGTIPAERCQWGWGAYREAPSKSGPMCSSCDAKIEGLISQDLLIF